MSDSIMYSSYIYSPSIKDKVTVYADIGEDFYVVDKLLSLLINSSTASLVSFQ